MHSRRLPTIEADVPMTGWMRFCLGAALLIIAIAVLVRAADPVLVAMVSGR